MSSIAGFDYHLSVDAAMARARERQLAHERDEALSKLDDATRRDLDETRRLLYAALAASRTKKYTLVGTLANALVHHSRLETGSPELIERLCDLVENGGPERWNQWAYDRIGQLTAEMESVDDARPELPPL